MQTTKNKAHLSLLILLILLILTIIFAFNKLNTNNYQGDKWSEKTKTEAERSTSGFENPSRLPDLKHKNTVSGYQANQGKPCVSSRSSTLSDRVKKDRYGLIDQSKEVFCILKTQFLTHFKQVNFIFTRVREKSQQKIDQNISFPESRLVHSMIFGGSSDLDPEMRHQLKIIGMQHVASASGYNVGLIVQLGVGAFSRFWSRRRVALGLGILVILYVGIAGASASLVRAAGMALLMTASRWWCFRCYRPLWGWTLTVAAMAMLNAAYVTDIGFQLSATATLGILLFGPPWLGTGSWLTASQTQETVSLSNATRQPQSRWQALRASVKEATVLSIASQLFSLPITIFHFGEVAGLSLVANVALGWLTPLITTSGIGLVSLAWVSDVVPILSTIVLFLGQIVSIPLALFTRAAAWLGQFESSLWHFYAFSLQGVIIWWLVVSAWWYPHNRRLSRSSSLQPAFFVAHLEEKR